MLGCTATANAQETPAERCARETAQYNQVWVQGWVAAHPGSTAADAPPPSPPYVCVDPGQSQPTTTTPQPTMGAVPTGTDNGTGIGVNVGGIGVVGGTSDLSPESTGAQPPSTMLASPQTRAAGDSAGTNAPPDGLSAQLTAPTTGTVSSPVGTDTAPPSAPAPIHHDARALPTPVSGGNTDDVGLALVIAAAAFTAGGLGAGRRRRASTTAAAPRIAAAPPEALLSRLVTTAAAPLMQYAPGGVERLAIAEGGGFRTLLLINDPTSPREGVVEIMAVPPGGRIVVELDGSASILDAGGNRVGGVAMPWAYDANGRPVLTRFVVRDGQLIQQVFADSDTAYPILADPPPNGGKFGGGGTAASGTGTPVDKSPGRSVPRATNPPTAEQAPAIGNPQIGATEMANELAGNTAPTTYNTANAGDGTALDAIEEQQAGSPQIGAGEWGNELAGNTAPTTYNSTQGSGQGSALEEIVTVPPPDPPQSDVDADPGAGVTSASDYWAALTPAQRERVIRTYPEWVGTHDGIPASARDRANRARLATERARLTAEEARLRSELGKPHPGNAFAGVMPPGQELAARELAETEHKIASLEAIENVLNRGDDQTRQLLLLDNSGDLTKAAISVGDVETADNVAVRVHGFTTTVDGGIEASDSDAANLKSQAELQLDREPGRENQTVAVVTWMGYEAPQMSAPLGVATSGKAESGADQLTSFLRGVEASRPADPNMTVLAHSYGSYTAGLAVQQNTPTDNVVFFGSPGIGTDTATDLQGTHGYALAADGDPVAGQAEIRSWIPPVAQLAINPLLALGQFGDAPTAVDGITELSTSEGAVPGDGHRVGSEGHSEYYKNQSMSLYNMAVVVAGLPHLVVTG